MTWQTQTIDNVTYIKIESEKSFRYKKYYIDSYKDGEIVTQLPSNQKNQYFILEGFYHAIEFTDPDFFKNVVSPYFSPNVKIDSFYSSNEAHPDNVMLAIKEEINAYCLKNFKLNENEFCITRAQQSIEDVAKNKRKLITIEEESDEEKETKKQKKLEDVEVTRATEIEVDQMDCNTYIPHYETSFFINYIKALQEIDKAIILSPIKTFADVPNSLEIYKDKIICCPDLSITVAESTQSPNFASQIETAMKFLSKIKEHLPKHVRLITHIDNNYFIGIDLEFKENKIIISYLNVSDRNQDQIYNQSIPILLFESITNTFKDARISVIKNTQLKNVECGPMMVEWLGLSSKSPKLTINSATEVSVSSGTQCIRPAEELKRGEDYLKLCAANMNKLKSMHLNFVNETLLSESSKEPSIDIKFGMDANPSDHSTAVVIEQTLVSASDTPNLSSVIPYPSNNREKPQQSVNTQEWYTTAFMIDYQTVLNSTSDNVYIVTKQQLENNGPYKNSINGRKIIYCTDITATDVNGTADPENLTSVITSIVRLLYSLGSNHPDHFRATVHIKNDHFVGFDIEFVSNVEINVSYLNTIKSPPNALYDLYDQHIVKRLITDIKNIFNISPNYIALVDSIQTNGSDCGPLMVEFLSLGTQGPKLITQHIPHTTPYQELVNNGEYLRACAKASMLMRKMHSNHQASQTNQAGMVNNSGKLADDVEMPGNLAEEDRTHLSSVTSTTKKETKSKKPLTNYMKVATNFTSKIVKTPKSKVQEMQLSTEETLEEERFENVSGLNNQSAEPFSNIIEPDKPNFDDARIYSTIKVSEDKSTFTFPNGESLPCIYRVRKRNYIFTLLDDHIKVSLEYDSMSASQPTFNALTSLINKRLTDSREYVSVSKDMTTLIPTCNLRIRSDVTDLVLFSIMQKLILSPKMMQPKKAANSTKNTKTAPIAKTNEEYNFEYRSSELDELIEKSKNVVLDENETIFYNGSPSNRIFLNGWNLLNSEITFTIENVEVNNQFRICIVFRANFTDKYTPYNLSRTLVKRAHKFYEDSIRTWSTQILDDKPVLLWSTKSKIFKFSELLQLLCAVVHTLPLQPSDEHIFFKSIESFISLAQPKKAHSSKRDSNSNSNECSITSEDVNTRENTFSNTPLNMSNIATTISMASSCDLSALEEEKTLELLKEEETLGFFGMLENEIDDESKNAPLDLPGDIWYAATFFYNYIEALEKFNLFNLQNPEIIICDNFDANNINKSDIKILWNFMTSITEISDTESENVENLKDKITEAVIFLSNLRDYGNLPKHFRAVTHIKKGHYVGVDVEFVSAFEINFSYLNSSTNALFNSYNVEIPAYFREALTQNFNNTIINEKIVVEKIQQNGRDCGPIMTEWTSLGTNAPKLFTDMKPANTPFEELSNGCNYLKSCGVGNASIEMRRMQQDFVNGIPPTNLTLLPQELYDVDYMDHQLTSNPLTFYSTTKFFEEKLKDFETKEEDTQKFKDSEIRKPQGQ